MTMKTDFENVMDDLLIETAHLKKETRTTDTAGNITAIVEPDITISCSIQPVSQKNWNVLEFGVPVTGEMVGYFKASYSQFGTDYEVEEGDTVTWNSVKYRVEVIMSAPENAGEVVYIKARLRHI